MQESWQVLNESKKMNENYEKNFTDQKIEHWVMDKAERWRDHYNNNYKDCLLYTSPSPRD